MSSIFEKGGILAAGALVGTFGLKIIKSKEAKEVFVKGASLGLKAKEYIMTNVTKARENIDDILEEAKEVNEAEAVAKDKRQLREEVQMIEDAYKAE